MVLDDVRVEEKNESGQAISLYSQVESLLMDMVYSTRDYCVWTLWRPLVEMY